MRELQVHRDMQVHGGHLDLPLVIVDLRGIHLRNQFHVHDMHVEK